MRNVSVHDVEDLPLDVLPLGTEYPPDFLLAAHQHRRAQLLYGASGTMEVRTTDGTWVVPPNRAVLIPPHVRHEVLMLGVTTWSLYIEPAAVPWWPRICTVVDVDGLLRELLRAANALDADYRADGRNGALITLLLHEIRALTPLPFHLVIPTEEPFRTLCTSYVAAPDVTVGNDEWARIAAMSVRSLDRRFREHTGTSPATWRARARLIVAVRLLERASVAEVGASLGYASPAGFTAAFTRAFGVPPSRMRQ